MARNGYVHFSVKDLNNIDILPASSDSSDNDIIPPEWSDDVLNGTTKVSIISMEEYKCAGSETSL